MLSLLRNLALESFAFTELERQFYVNYRHVVAATKFFFHKECLTDLLKTLRVALSEHFHFQFRRRPADLATFYFVRRYAKFITHRTFRRIASLSLFLIVTQVLDMLFQNLAFLALEFRAARVSNRLVMLAVRADSNLGRLFPGLIPDAGVIEDAEIRSLEKRMDEYRKKRQLLFAPPTETVSILPLI